MKRINNKHLILLIIANIYLGVRMIVSPETVSDTAIIVFGVYFLLEAVSKGVSFWISNK